MVDIRISRLARLLTEYSIGVRDGDEVLIRAGVEALPLVREVYRQVLQFGGYPHLILQDDILEEIFYRYADKKRLEYLSPIEKFMIEKIDASITIISRSHVKPLIGISPEKLRLRKAATREIMEIFMRRHAAKELRWVVSVYPTNALAQEAGMSPIEYEDFVYDACMVDSDNPTEKWRAQAEEQEKIVELLAKLDELRIISEDTDLTLKIGGRKWINDDGHYNMPAGEVFSAPVEDSAEGEIRFTYPAIWSGIEVEDVKLVFKRGEIVEAYAVKGEDKLREIIRTDDGARKIGEIAFGLNYSIKKYTRQILFDEKIGGSIHIALGAAYPDTGGENKSAIHWDFILDMKNGKVYGDGSLIYEYGSFKL
ncbi:MAG: aminopeptidase [Candidatus Caldarchaeales archaeon]